MFWSIVISPTSHRAGSEVECLARAWDLQSGDTGFQSLSEHWLARFLGSPQLDPLVVLANRHLVASCQMFFFFLAFCVLVILFFVRDVLGRCPKTCYKTRLTLTLTSFLPGHELFN